MDIGMDISIDTKYMSIIVPMPIYTHAIYVYNYI